MAIILFFKSYKRITLKNFVISPYFCYTPLADPPLSGAAVVSLRPPCSYCSLTDSRKFEIRLLSDDIIFITKFHKNRANAQTLRQTGRQTDKQIATHSDTNAEVYFRPEFSLRQGRTKPAVTEELQAYFTPAYISSPTGLTLLLLQLSLLIS